MNIPAAEPSNDSVDDGNILPSYIIYHDFSNLRIHASIPQKKQVASLERGLHRTRQDDDYGGGRIGDD